jgi:protein-disulfide isomerase
MNLRLARPLAGIAALVATALLYAQDTPDTVFKPPKGSKVAIVVFEDLECPKCANTVPLLEKASKDYKIPVVRHDFPLPDRLHPWAHQAAVMARFFDAHSLGDDFRDYIFQNQLEINPTNLRSYADKFATSHKLSLPFVIDSDEKFSKEVDADRALGNAIKIEHTPTVFVVSSKHPSKPYIEVKDDDKLYATIDEMMKE